MKPPTRSATDPPAGTTTAGVGLALVRAMANKDNAGLCAVFAPGVEFRALTPGREWRADSPEEVADLVLGTWFGSGTEVVQVASVECTEVAGRARIDYEFRLRRPDGPATVAQTAYYAVRRGRVVSVRLLCSGILPTAGDQPHLDR